jgi:hypothetical protein
MKKEESGSGSGSGSGVHRHRECCDVFREIDFRGSTELGFDRARAIAL